MVNAEMERRKGHVSLLMRIDGAEMSLADWCDKYRDARLDGKPNSVAAMKSQINAIKESPFHAQSLLNVKPREISLFVDACVAERGATMASNIRKRLEDVFREAIAHGMVEVGKNPVTAIQKPEVTVTRNRLTLDDFKLILAKAREDKERCWAANAIELALICGQRREDIVSMQFSQVKDGFLWIEQSKGKEGSKSKLKIPLSLRLNAIDTSLDDVLRRCRDNVATKNVIHFITRNGAAVPGNAPCLSTMSQTFARIRDELIVEKKITVPDGKTPPSFHEIRSLAARLYAEERSPEFAQALLGHKSATMTELYRDLRGREWTEIKLSAG